MADVALSKNGMMFVTQEGEGFSGVWAGEYKKHVEKKGGQEHVMKSMIATILSLRMSRCLLNW